MGRCLFWISSLRLTNSHRRQSWEAKALWEGVIFILTFVPSSQYKVDYNRYFNHVRSLFHRKSFLVWRTLWESLETSLVLLPGQDFLRRMLQLLMWGISLDQEVPRRWRAALQEMTCKQRKQMTTRQGWSTWETLTLRSPEVPTFPNYFWAKYTFSPWQWITFIKNLLGIYASSQ